mmetsp:Transcript_12521/g.50310  ORF Transcript_12521/g.50310 Transcript_12521/m.50310 type:complete len:780 (+) Transcript_12521:248-2587(+)
MAVSLEERVAGHSDFFDRLVELIPARYYVPDEANPEWSKFQKTKSAKAAAKQAAKENSKKALRAKLQPGNAMTSLEKMRLKEGAEGAAEPGAEAEEDSDEPESENESDFEDDVSSSSDDDDDVDAAAAAEDDESADGLGNGKSSDLVTRGGKVRATRSRALKAKATRATTATKKSSKKVVNTSLKKVNRGASELRKKGPINNPAEKNDTKLGGDKNSKHNNKQTTTKSTTTTTTTTGKVAKQRARAPAPERIPNGPTFEDADLVYAYYRELRLRNGGGGGPPRAPPRRRGRDLLLPRTTPAGDHRLTLHASLLVKGHEDVLRLEVVPAHAALRLLQRPRVEQRRPAHGQQSHGLGDQLTPPGLAGHVVKHRDVERDVERSRPQGQARGVAGENLEPALDGADLEQPERKIATHAAPAEGLNPRQVLAVTAPHVGDEGPGPDVATNEVLHPAPGPVPGAVPLRRHRVVHPLHVNAFHDGNRLGDGDAGVRFVRVVRVGTHRREEIRRAGGARANLLFPLEHGAVDSRHFPSRLTRGADWTRRSGSRLGRRLGRLPGLLLRRVLAQHPAADILAAVHRLLDHAPLAPLIRLLLRRKRSHAAYGADWTHRSEPATNAPRPRLHRYRDRPAHVPAPASAPLRAPRPFVRLRGSRLTPSPEREGYTLGGHRRHGVFVRVGGVALDDDGGPDRERNHALLVEPFLAGWSWSLAAFGPSHPAAQHHRLLGAQRDGDERSVERGVVDVRRDPLARAVQVDGAGIRALKLGERPAGDERVDDGVELGG